MQEIWKDIKDYEGRYRISSFGNAKTIIKGNDLVLKSYVANSGYLFIRPFKDKKFHNLYIHSMVAMTFLNHVPNKGVIAIDHIDNNRLNNHVNNLQIISVRENISKTPHKKNYSSKYTGVCLNKSSNTWLSRILINGQRKYLGQFKNEYDAHLAYQKALSELNINLK